MTTAPKLPEALAATLADSDASPAIADQLRDLESTLRTKGLAEEARDIGEMREQASAMGQVGRRIGGLAGNLKEMAARQWHFFLREMGESREAVSLLRRRMSGEIKSFSPAEQELVRDQVADLFRMVPATALALAPVPGIAVITPFVLKKLNLLPSAWREANLLHRLQETAAQLEEKGEVQEAQRLREVAAQVRAKNADRSDRLRTLRQHPSIRLLYDFNMDGEIDDDEWALLKTDRQHIRACAGDDSQAPRWYFTTDGETRGPVALAELRAMPLPDQTLITVEGLARWIPFELLFEIVDDPAALSHDVATPAGQETEP